MRKTLLASLLSLALVGQAGATPWHDLGPRAMAMGGAGVALSPFKFWHLTADLDMTENLTLIDGYKTRYAGVGTEINVVNRPRFNLPLRAGLKKNLSDTTSGVAFTAGAGLNFFHFTLDIAGQVSAKRTQLQSEGKNEKVPNNVAASIQLGFLFGQKDEGGRE